MFNSFRFLFLFLFYIISISVNLKAQIRINKIQLEGNNRTKNYILLRELPYHVGDQINKDSLNFLNTLSQQQLFNTSLFLSVNVTSIYPLINDSSIVDIQIKVKERW